MGYKGLQGVTKDYRTYISVWICKNVATEISLICPLTESRSGSYFFFSRLLFICLIGNGLATVDRV